MNSREQRAREMLGDAAVDAAHRSAESAPPLRPEQRDALAVLLRPTRTDKAPERAA